MTRAPRLEPLANAISSIGLTIPSFALIGLLLPVLGLGFWPALVAVGFYAVFPVLRNAVVGLQGVNADLLESAKGMGMSEAKSLFQVRLPLAWPVILAGVRVSTQMSMGVAAIAAYVLGPGFGAWIFTGLAQTGGKNGTQLRTQRDDRRRHHRARLRPPPPAPRQSDHLEGNPGMTAPP